MRPEEINYSSQTRHFFDTSNGEVLAGKNALRAYIKAGADEEPIADLGDLLRRPGPVLETVYPPIDTSDWEPARFAAYGKWINKIVAPPIDEGEKRLNQDVLTTAARLGIGPGRRAIRKVFGTYGNFYKEIKAADTHIIGNFKDWSMDDYLAYIRKIGGNRRPTAEAFDERAKRDPSKPKADYMRATFRDIGGFNKLLELAGYLVVDLWDKDDYVDWGVKFMRVNEGLLPTSRMADFLSQKQAGPSGAVIRDKFIKMGVFQREVLQKYAVAEQARQEEEATILQQLHSELASGDIPSELFVEKDMVQDLTNMSPEILMRYAKYKVLSYAIPGMTQEAKVALSSDHVTAKQFVTLARKHNQHVTAGDLEHSALVQGFFDVIFPADNRLEELRIGEEYEAYYKRIEGVKKLHHRKLIAAK